PQPPQTAGPPTGPGPVATNRQPPTASQPQGKMLYPPPPLVDEDEDEKPGDVYEGGMEHGVRTGKGTYAWSAAGASYTGEYVANKKHGKGTMTYPDKGVYEGDWVEDVMQGTGTYTYASGDVYQGGFQAGKRHGQGMYHFRAPCCQLVGDWKEGAFTYGRWVFRDGSMFMGKFQGESRPEAGSYYYSGSSLVQEGHFEAGGGWVGHADPVVGQVSEFLNGRWTWADARKLMMPEGEEEERGGHHRSNRHGHTHSHGQQASRLGQSPARGGGAVGTSGRGDKEAARQQQHTHSPRAAADPARLAQFHINRQPWVRGDYHDIQVTLSRTFSQLHSATFAAAAAAGPAAGPSSLSGAGPAPAQQHHKEFTRATFWIRADDVAE
ncbi:Radial spoke head 1, partial [Tetrabaena socialis]